MQSELPLVPGRGLSTRTATELRQAFMREHGIIHDAIGNHHLDTQSIQNNIESFVGSTEIPIGLVGPIVFNQNDSQEFVYAPVGTLEGALVASMNRGAKVIARSNGFTAQVEWQRMVRSPMFLFENETHIEPVMNWIPKHFKAIKAHAQEYSNHAQLLQIVLEPLGSTLNLKFIYETGDASGQNMTTTCTWHALLYMAERLRVELPECLFEFIIEGNGASDKKVSQSNISEGRGVRVTAQCDIPRQVIHEVLRTTPETILKFFGPSVEFAKKSGMVGFNVNVANAIAGIFVATGQDLACIHESSTGFLHLEALGSSFYPDGIRITLLLPNLVIGTVGGGTHLAKQSEALNMMGCLGSGKVKRFAQLIAGFAMGLEISTYSAIMSGEFAKAHEKLGRNKPVSWLLKSEITPEFLNPLMHNLLSNDQIVSLSWRDQHQLENGIITNITRKISNKLIGFIPLHIQLSNGSDDRILIKSKALDTEVIKGLHLISASIDTELADLIKHHQKQLEYHQCHLKETVIYEHLHQAGYVAMPKFFGKYTHTQREIHLLIQEWIKEEHIALSNSENHPENWTDDWIQVSLSSIQTAHKVLETLPQTRPELFTEFKPWQALNLYGKLMNILIEECADIDHIEALQDIKASLLTLESDHASVRWPKSLIHNDFNPRNTLMRNSGMPCIYDWELAMIDFPQRDIIEFLSFVLPENFPAQSLMMYLKEHYREIVQRKGPGHELGFEEYLKATEMALRTYICCRVSFYEVSGIVAKYDFSPRILAVSLRMHQIIESELQNA
jgi:hydroxymethylglutaryl-CoA reductase (NADPH)